MAHHCFVQSEETHWFLGKFCKGYKSDIMPVGLKTLLLTGNILNRTRTTQADQKMRQKIRTGERFVLG